MIDKPKKVILFFLLVITSFYSVGREKLTLSVKDISKQPIENRLNYFFALEYSWQKDLSNFKRIDSLKMMAKQLGDDRLAEYCQLLWYEYKIYFAKNSRQKASYFNMAEKFTENSDNPELKAHLYYAIGIYAFYLKEIDYGLPLIYQSKRLLEKINYHQFRHRSYYYKGFFDLFFHFEDFKSAISVGELARKDPNNLLYYPADYFNDIGLCYRRLKDYDLALKYYERAIADAKKRNDASFMALVRGNVGKIFYLNKQFKEALAYLYEDFNMNESKIPEEANYVRYLIANCLLQLDSVKKAETFLKYPDTKIPIWTHPAFKSDKYKVMSLYYKKTGNFKLSTQYLDSLVILKDSIKNKYDLNKIKLFESQLQAEKFLLNETTLENEIDRQKLLRNGGIVMLTIIFVSVFSMLFYRYGKEKQIQLQKQKLSTEQLASANAQLNLFLDNLKEKNKLLDKMSFELEQTNQRNPEVIAQTNAYLDNLRKSVILTDENWCDFKEIFEKIHPNFFSELLQHYSELSPAETKLVVLQKLEMPTKEMANTLGISSDSIKKAKYRLKKKYPEMFGEKKSDAPEDQEESY